MFGAVDPRRLGVVEGEELAAVEVAPLPLDSVVVDRELDLALRAGEPGPLWMVDPYIDPAPSADNSTRLTSYGDSRPKRWR